MNSQELSNLFYLFVSTMFTVGAEYMRRRMVEKEHQEHKAATAAKPKKPAA